MTTKKTWDYSKLDYLNSKRFFNFNIENLRIQSKITDQTKKEEKFYQIHGKARDKELEGIQTTIYIQNNFNEIQKETGLGAFYLYEQKDNISIIISVFSQSNIYDEIYKCIEIGKFFEKEVVLTIETPNNLITFLDIVYGSFDSKLEEKTIPIYSVEICNML